MVNESLIDNMERRKRLPPNLPQAVLTKGIERIIAVIVHMLDRDIFVWFDRDEQPTSASVQRAATIVQIDCVGY